LFTAAAGAVWVLLFCGLFFASNLPNVGLERMAVLLQLPEILAANFGGSPDSGWHTLPQRFDLMATAAFILAGAWGLGRLTLLALRVESRPLSAEDTAYAGGVGLSLWSLLTLALGLAGPLSQPLFAGLLLAFLLGGVWSCRAALPGKSLVAPDARHGSSASDFTPRSLQWGTLAVCAPFVLAMLLGAMLPSTDFDVKEYHLQGPKEHYLAGRILFLPHNVYTSFPFLTETLSLSAMVVRGEWFRGALAGKTVLMAFAPLTALAVFALTRRLFGAAAGWFAATVFLTTPWIYRISIIAYTEGALCCYLALATLAFVGWTERRTTGRVLLMGLFAGSAAAAKYPGVVSVVIPLGVAALISEFLRRSTTDPGEPERGRGLQLARTAAVYSAGVLAAFGPWLLKNLIETGNPVYPLLWSLFGGESFDAATNARWEAAHGPPGFLLREPAKILPDLFVHLRDVAIASDWQSPLLFALAPLALLFPGRRREAACLWGCVGWLFFTWLWMTHRIDRFWLPMIPLLASLAGAGMVVLWKAFARWREEAATPAPLAVAALVAATMAVCIAFNLGIVTSAIGGFNGYLLDQRVARDMATGESVKLLEAAGVGAGDRVLFVGEAAVLDARFDHVYNTVFDDSLFERWFGEEGEVASARRGLRSPEEIRRTLEQHGVTHVLVNWSEVIRYRLPGSYGFTDFVHPSQFEQLIEAGVLERTRFVLTSRWEDLSESRRQEVMRWAPELLAGGGKAVRSIEIYRVMSE
jgi:hypothetical protein